MSCLALETEPAKQAGGNRKSCFQFGGCCCCCCCCCCCYRRHTCSSGSRTYTHAHINKYTRTVSWYQTTKRSLSSRFLCCGLFPSKLCRRDSFTFFFVFFFFTFPPFFPLPVLSLLFSVSSVYPRLTSAVVFFITHLQAAQLKLAAMLSITKLIMPNQ